jgi:hypothetical protein
MVIAGPMTTVFTLTIQETKEIKTHLVFGSSADGNWEHYDRFVSMTQGDVINYWVYVIKGGVGYQILDRSWTYGG